MCTWPHGGRPEIPLRYCDEVWTGVEYQVAAHCLDEGMHTEATAILTACSSATTAPAATRSTRSSAATTTCAPWPAGPCWTPTPASATTPRPARCASAPGRDASRSWPAPPGAPSRSPPTARSTSTSSAAPCPSTSRPAHDTNSVPPPLTPPPLTRRTTGATERHRDAR
ncbi:hypothetical protein ACQEVZ_55875 [Dactylosporangium sp. CA-152071]|uniref:hypothetical protein n=1 Tax=Dactylosporangium sp. CA-152071 TaxID=3239933 RepID=UPI003D8C57AF